MGFGEDFFTVLAALATPTAEELADARALRAEKRADDAERALRAERRATPMVDIKSAILAEAFGLPLAPKNTDLVGVLKGTDRYYRDEALRGLVNLGGCTRVDAYKLVVEHGRLFPPSHARELRVWLCKA
jgi:hypothetical protein